MKVIFNPLTGKFDYVASTVADVGLTGLATNITAGKTLTLAAADDFTLTVPATGTAALLATANVFTTIQTITPATDVVGLIINKSTTADAWQLKSGATVLAGLQGRGTFYANLGTAASNFFIGANAGNSTNTGIYNVAIGNNVLDALTTGERNVGI